MGVHNVEQELVEVLDVVLRELLPVPPATTEPSFESVEAGSSVIDPVAGQHRLRPCATADGYLDLVVLHAELFPREGSSSLSRFESECFGKAECIGGLQHQVPLSRRVVLDLPALVVESEHLVEEPVHIPVSNSLDLKGGTFRASIDPDRIEPEMMTPVQGGQRRGGPAAAFASRPWSTMGEPGRTPEDLTTIGHPTPSGITLGGPTKDRERLGGCLLVDLELDANAETVAVDDDPGDRTV